MWLGFRDQDSVRLSGDVYPRGHGSLPSGDQSADLSSLVPPGGIYGGGPLDWPVNAALGEARLLLDDWKLGLGDFGVSWSSRLALLGSRNRRQEKKLAKSYPHGANP